MKPKCKLRLARETLRRLGSSELHAIDGAMGTTGCSVDPTVCDASCLETCVTCYCSAPCRDLTAPANGC